MDPDMEFNALNALYQSVVHDMKSSYPAWETVGQRALKLSQSLRSTVNCFTAFVESVQTVSDYANNLKGASRDVGACVTRVCMRERAIEGRLRGFADALADELALGIQQRTAYWRQRTSELDKAASKHVKKVRSRKGRPDPTSLSEQRQLCTQILMEQRSQFSFFIGTLMPALHAQMGLLDEGPHIRQVIETLEDTMKCVDSTSLVNTIISDISEGADSAWKQCLATATRSFREDTSTVSSRAITPCSNYTDDNDMTPMGGRPHGLGTLPRYSNGSTQGLNCSPPTKPPLQRRPSDRSINKLPSCSSPPSDHPHAPSTYRSQYDIHQTPTRINSTIQRPQSFTAELRNTYPQTSSFATPLYGSSSCSSSDAASSAALIAETLQQIDQLGSDLENYCVTNEIGKSSGGMRDAVEYSQIQKPHLNGSQASSSTSTIVNGVRIRSESASRPPPPTRRSSTIMAATPTAPSIVDARMHMGSVMGSRQSLNSAGIYCSSMGSNQDLRYPNINPYVTRQSQPNFNI